VVDLDREAELPDEAAVLRDAIHEFFSQRAQAYWAASARIVSCGPDQPCDRARCFSIGDCIGRFSSCFDEGAAVSARSFAKALRSVAGSPCGVLSRFSCTTGGRFAVKLAFPSGSQQRRYASDMRTPKVPTRGEKTGRRCRQELNGRAARPSREL
jgi:hypothetical protein